MDSFLLYLMKYQSLSSPLTRTALLQQPRIPRFPPAAQGWSQALSSLARAIVFMAARYPLIRQQLMFGAYQQQVALRRLPAVRFLVLKMIRTSWLSALMIPRCSPPASYQITFFHTISPQAELPLGLVAPALRAHCMCLP